MCGENDQGVGGLNAVPGSSPRVRGKHALTLENHRAVRLIPACAGKTAQSTWMPAPRWAHPRVCGENAGYSERHVRRWGSSPRVRGKLPPHLRNTRVSRLIPACAGKTALLTCPEGDCWAHPRVCGENFVFCGFTCGKRGSSPRVRGKRGDILLNHANHGLIPACAGKTDSALLWESPSRAHPRVCGENGIRGLSEDTTIGSSPRVRGKRFRTIRRQPARRLIPACAGKTLAGRGLRSACRAHPRVCGENTVAVTALTQKAGSSPRVRGKLSVTESRPGRDRLIPACAGKTHGSGCVSADSAAHPRVCGENPILTASARHSLGSSPRVRGKRVALRVERHQVGLIPACAGKTAFSPHTELT